MQENQRLRNQAGENIMSSPAHVDQWGTRIEVKSASSSKIYIVSEKLDHGRPTGTYGCSCPGWKSYGGQCKHLRSMGYMSCRPRREPRPKGHGVSDNRAFSDAAYAHYNIRDGYGSADEWIRQAEEHARGRGKYRSTGYRTSATNNKPTDMQLLGLSEMPAIVDGLKRAMRKMAKKLHPDFGGDPKAFGDMIMAYERLLKMY